MSNYNDEVYKESEIECQNCHYHYDNESFSLDIDKEFCDGCFDTVNLIKKLKTAEIESFLIESSTNYLKIIKLPIDTNNIEVINPSKFGISGVEFQNLITDFEKLNHEKTEILQQIFDFQVRVYEIK